MERIIRLLARAVRKSPWSIVLASLIVTVVLGSFISQQETTQGNEGFAPDAPEWTASLTISERFASNSETPMQVLFEAESGDVLTAGGLQAYAAAVDAVIESEAAPYLSDRADGAVQGFFGPLLQGLQMEGVPVTALADDAAVKGAFNDSLGQLPPEFAGFFTQLLSSENTDLSVPSSTWTKWASRRFSLISPRSCEKRLPNPFRCNPSASSSCSRIRTCSWRRSEGSSGRRLRSFC